MARQQTNPEDASWGWFETETGYVKAHEIRVQHRRDTQRLARLRKKAEGIAESIRLQDQLVEWGDLTTQQADARKRELGDELGVLGGEIQQLEQNLVRLEEEALKL